MGRLPNLPKALEDGLRLEEGSRDNSILHVSDLSATLPGEGCPRQLWLRIHGADERELTAGQLLMFRHGSRIHEDLIPYLTKGLDGTDWEIEAIEYPLIDKDIIGTTDLILKNAANNTYVIVDFKSLRGNAFRFLDPEYAKPAHELQVQTYIYLCSKQAVCDPMAGVVLYVDREGQNAFQQRTVPVNNTRVKAAIEEAKLIISQSEPPEVLPPNVKQGKPTKTKGTPVYLSMPWNCEYCQYRDVSCPGALTYDYRDMGVVGHTEDGEFTPTKELPDDLIVLIEQELCQPIPF